MRKPIWGLTAALCGYAGAKGVIRLLRERFSVQMTDRTALTASVVTAAVLALIALVLAGNRNLERARLLGYAKQACAPESDRKRLSRQLVSEVMILILLNASAVLLLVWLRR